MVYNRRDLKLIEYKFVSTSSRLLQSVVDDFPHVLSLFLDYIDGTEMIAEYINGCGTINTNIQDSVKAVAGSYGREKFDFGDTIEDEVVGIYSLLKYLDSVKCASIYGIIMGYANGSKHYDDMLHNFNNRVSAVLINHIVDYLTGIGIQMGADETQTFNITVQQGGIAQLNIAQDNSSVTAQQNNTSDLQKLGQAIQNLQDSAIDFSEEDRSEVIDCSELIREETASEKPKKSVIKLAVDKLKSIGTKVPEVVEFGAAVAQIVAVLTELKFI